ncbi:MAG: hypothetical protein ABIQ15_10305 [Nocardioides sp.]
MSLPGRRQRRTASTFMVLALLVVASVAPAWADGGDDRVEKRGWCSQGAEWRIRASPEDGRIEIEGGIDSGRSGQRWKWRMFHNDTLSAMDTAWTGGVSGSFEVRRQVTDLAGTDRYSFRARNPDSREWCRGPLAY